jgi:asparagine synthetase B (glutamine-hydrolysing)
MALAHNQGCNFQCTSGLVERRYPFLDQGLIEFILSIPRDQLLRPGERRSLMRRALKGLVPDEILSRKTKGTVSRRPLLAIANDWNQLGDILDDSVMAQHGFVDQHKLRDALLAAKGGDAPQLLRLLSTISLELWLRDMARRGLLSLSDSTRAKDLTVARTGLRTAGAPTNIGFLADAETSSPNAET